jgi:hypothetical protein
VVYRLRRIKERSGRDRHDLDDLLLRFRGLKVAELRSEPNQERQPRRQARVAAASASIPSAASGALAIRK